MPRRTQKAVSVYVEPAEFDFLWLAARRDNATLANFIREAALAKAEKITGMTLNRFAQERAARGI